MSPRKAKKRKKCWHSHAGTRPHRVEVCERTPGGMLYERIWDPRAKKRRYRSLGHRDQELAIAFAEDEARKLRTVREAARGEPTVAGILTLYLLHRTPEKTAETSKREDKRRAEMWMRLLGEKRVIDLGDDDWQSFVRLRSTGAIDAKGHTIPESPKGVRKPVGPRTVDADLVFLIAVFNWGLRFKMNGRRLLKENPFGAPAPGVKRALERPRNRAPKRPVATYDRYLAVRAAATTMKVFVEGAEEAVPVYLPELLDLSVQTGRRISAICRLWYSDIVRSGREITAIRWRPFKKEDEQVIPVSKETRETLARILAARPSVGDTPLFPAPKNPAVSMTRFLARDWLHRAETIAGVETVEGGDWHPYRRMWATVRKHLPTKDVMKVGGWKDERSLRESYQHADMDTMLEVVNEPRQLREKKTG